ncbi:hypothetical protein [Prochlorothrix hollandica]
MVQRKPWSMLGDNLVSPDLRDSETLSIADAIGDIAQPQPGSDRG